MVYVMKKKVLKLLKKYDVNTIEKSLIQLFLKQHNLKSNNLFLNEYISSFEMISKKDIDNIILKNCEMLSIEHLERYFELLFSSKDKKLGGIYYTPEYISQFIIKEVINDNPNIKIMDPSCGAGIFSYITVLQLKEKFPKKSRKVKKRQLKSIKKGKNIDQRLNVVVYYFSPRWIYLLLTLCINSVYNGSVSCTNFQ